MKKLIFSLCSGLTILVLAGCSLWGANQSGALTASGTIEADRVHVSAELSGKIVAVNVDQGDAVEAGAALFQVDDAALRIQREQAQAALAAAEAALATAQANLDLVKAGSTEAQLRAARAQLEAAEANRAALQATIWAATAGARPEEVSAAQARLDWARQAYYQQTATLSPTQLEEARKTVNLAENNLTSVKNRQMTLADDQRNPESALTAAATATEEAQRALDAAQAAQDALEDVETPFYEQARAAQAAWEAARINRSLAEARRVELDADENMTEAALDAANATADDARSLEDQAQAAYDLLTDSDQARRLQTAWDDLASAQTDLNALARATTGSTTLESLLNQLAAVSAQRDAAAANLQLVSDGARPEQAAMAQGQFDAATAQAAAARAAVDLLDLQLSKATVKAPTGGVILNRALNAGEMTAAGVTVVELAQLDEVKLTVYIPEDQYGKIQLGQEAVIRVDSFPGKTYTGVVETISDQAEFTPRNVQTVENRSATVYAIIIRIANPDLELKPGMPADATF